MEMAGERQEREPGQCGEGRRPWKGCHMKVNLVVKLINQLRMEIGELTWRLKRVLNEEEGKKGDGDRGAEGRERYDGVRRLTGVKGSISLSCRSPVLEKRGVTVVRTTYVCILP